jgi:hypothetical protein
LIDDWEDIASELVMLVMRRANNARLTGNLFAYYSTFAIHMVRHAMSAAAKRYKLGVPTDPDVFQGRERKGKIRPKEYITDRL